MSRRWHAGARTPVYAHNHVSIREPVPRVVRTAAVRPLDSRSPASANRAFRSLESGTATRCRNGCPARSGRPSADTGSEEAMRCSCHALKPNSVPSKMTTGQVVTSPHSLHENALLWSTSMKESADHSMARNCFKGANARPSSRPSSLLRLRWWAHWNATCMWLARVGERAEQQPANLETAVPGHDGTRHELHTGARAHCIPTAAAHTKQKRHTRLLGGEPVLQKLIRESSPLGVTQKTLIVAVPLKCAATPLPRAAELERGNGRREEMSVDSDLPTRRLPRTAAPHAPKPHLAVGDCFGVPRTITARASVAADARPLRHFDPRSLEVAAHERQPVFSCGTGGVTHEQTRACSREHLQQIRAQTAVMHSVVSARRRCRAVRSVGADPRFGTARSARPSCSAALAGAGARRRASRGRRVSWGEIPPQGGCRSRPT